LRGYIGDDADGRASYKIGFFMYFSEIVLQKEEYKHINISQNNIYSNKLMWYNIKDVKG
jgi:hypothetical protein